MYQVLSWMCPDPTSTLFGETGAPSQRPRCLPAALTLGHSPGHLLSTLLLQSYPLRCWQPKHRERQATSSLPSLPVKCVRSSLVAASTRRPHTVSSTHFSSPDGKEMAKRTTALSASLQLATSEVPSRSCHSVAGSAEGKPRPGPVCPH